MRAGDTVIVWKLDRLGRSLNDLIETLTLLKDRGADFISLTEKIDTTTPGGKLIFHLMGALAEFERDLIRMLVLSYNGQPVMGSPWWVDTLNVAPGESYLSALTE
ncbi:hypothetical protein KTT_55100 [Tengunoibacter tsumagoiensis]|uniref:Resolvase/invertase-type recombinase catalytic domain-containing protein n=1 Tax=Tengunoibacter tsumagoiensis TaxID=2014871 RepID=A0A402A9M0_9CHLR|nr:hypothetical protein KTT_55100 [Tengunoibacter tsumagoiensis]